MGWKKTTLREISENIQTGPFGSQLHSSDYSEIGTPVVMPKDLSGGHISEDTIARVSSSHVSRLARHKIEKNDIIYSRRGDVGKCALATGKEKGWLCGTGCLRVTVDIEKASPKYIFYQLQQPQTVGWVENHAVGSTMKNLNTTILGNIPLEIPSLAHQNRVVSILSSYDDLLENNQKQIKLLEEAAQRLYKEWFVDLRFPGHENVKIVDGVPEGWRYGELQDIAIDAGKKEKKSNREEYSYYLPIDCLPRKSLAYNVTNDITCAESSLVGFKANDIIFGAMRPYFHKVVFARGKGLTRNTCFVINAKEPLFWAFLLLLMFSKDTIQYANQISVGTTMPYVRWQDFIHMPIIIPELRICKSFQRVIVNITKRISCLSDSCIKLQEARDRLLPKLISGEIQV